MNFVLEAQKLNSYSKTEQLTTQKGTGDSYTSVMDMSTKNALRMYL